MFRLRKGTVSMEPRPVQERYDFFPRETFFFVHIFCPLKFNNISYVMNKENVFYILSRLLDLYNLENIYIHPDLG